MASKCNNDMPRKETGGEWDDDAGVDMMLWWVCGVTKKDNIRNEHVRGSVKVVSVAEKITENRLKRYMLRRKADAKQNRCIGTEKKPGRHTPGNCEAQVGDIIDRTAWKTEIQNYSGDPT